MAFLSRPARFALALLIAAVLSPAAAAQDSVRMAEQDIKAGLLYNFLRYTHWPDASRSDSAMVVCFYGRDPFGGRLSPMAGRTVNQRTIVVRAVRAHSEIDTCSLFFLNADERASWPDLHAYLTRRNVLTVSDYEGFARSGGMIEFTRINNRIGVRVNVGAAEAANLIVQDRLLRLASVVETASP